VENPAHEIGAAIRHTKNALVLEGISFLLYPDHAQIYVLTMRFILTTPTMPHAFSPNACGLSAEC
jgi:hypothetical protein